MRLVDGGLLNLSEREAALLEYFALHPGRIIDREELLRGVWQIDAQGVNTRTVDMHVARLREKLQAAAGSMNVIKTVRGRGYLMDPALAGKRGCWPGRELRGG